MSESNHECAASSTFNKCMSINIPNFGWQFCLAGRNS